MQLVLGVDLSDLVAMQAALGVDPKDLVVIQAALEVDPKDLPEKSSFCRQENRN